jgi:hypothetical protein
MNNNMTPQEALQLLSDALEPRNINAISRAGFIAIQKALEVLAEVVAPKPSEQDATND